MKQICLKQNLHSFVLFNWFALYLPCALCHFTLSITFSKITETLLIITTTFTFSYYFHQQYGLVINIISLLGWLFRFIHPWHMHFDSLHM